MLGTALSLLGIGLVVIGVAIACGGAIYATVKQPNRMDITHLALAGIVFSAGTTLVAIGQWLR